MKFGLVRRGCFNFLIIFTFSVFVMLMYFYCVSDGDLSAHKNGVYTDKSQRPVASDRPARFDSPKIVYTLFPPEKERKRKENGEPLRILITGGAGFIGSQLGAYLHRRGYEVILLDNMAFGHADNLVADGKRFGQFVLADVLDERTYPLYREVDTVFHFAAISALPVCQQHPRYAIDVNVAGVASALEASRLASVRRFILSSTSAVYENNSEPVLLENLTVRPHLLYSLSKYQAEALVQGYNAVYGMDCVIMRFFNVYGPHQDFRRRSPPFTSYIVRELLRGRRPVLHGSGTQARDYIYITDLIDLAERLMFASNAKGEIVNVASGIAYSTREMFEIVARIIHKEGTTPEFHPAKMFWDAYPTLFRGSHALNESILEKEVEKRVLGSFIKAEKLFGWRPNVSLQEGLKMVVNYIKGLDKTKLDTPTGWSASS